MSTMTISPLFPLKIDYVTKAEFKEHKSEMNIFRISFEDFRKDMYVFKDDIYAFRTETKTRFDGIDTRLDGVDKRLESMNKSMTDFRNELPVYMGVLRDGFRDNLRIVLDSVKSLGEKVDKNKDELLAAINNRK